MDLPFSRQEGTWTCQYPRQADTQGPTNFIGRQAYMGLSIIGRKSHGPANILGRQAHKWPNNAIDRQTHMGLPI